MDRMGPLTVKCGCQMRVAGTVEARIQNRSLSCGFAAQGNGSNLLSAAEAKAAAIKVQFA
jgi:hypothetical protein